jgi:hypothetical protein
MSTDIDVPVGTDRQDEFPGHCSYCGELCQICAAFADQGDVPHD